MTDLSSLSKHALAAAMTGGTESWGEWGSAVDHVRYMEANTSKRMCRCGCRKRANWSGRANGITLTMGCELTIRRWVKTGHR